MLLPDYLVEGLGTPFAVKDLGNHSRLIILYMGLIPKHGKICSTARYSESDDYPRIYVTLREHGHTAVLSRNPAWIFQVDIPQIRFGYKKVKIPRLFSSKVRSDSCRFTRLLRSIMDSYQSWHGRFRYISGVSDQVFTSGLMYVRDGFKVLKAVSCD